MIWGLIRQWWHCLRHMHRAETATIGWPKPHKPIGFDCECGEHFWFDPRYKVEYLAIRAVFKEMSTGNTGVEK